MVKALCLVWIVLVFLFLSPLGARFRSPRPSPRQLAKRAMVGVKVGRSVVFVGYMRVA